MSERKKQIQFLKALACREESTEHQMIREKIHKAELDERCLLRVIFLLIVLTLLSMVSLSYAVVFWPRFFHDWSQLLLKLGCSMGLASILCLIGFSGYWLWRRALLNRLYNECRRLVMLALKFPPELK